ncbi:hypothetical protein PSTG_06764 [Puccinia striiformis f. sp. tritici PST-78]|uniref:Uncharacterized protein n=1 Tax=Puccinia striiformis f. sp. tritici PST-78 TaxID=1165861 RepID=A0A0L0VL10_9BASI|nr:hypothetical protein PSTG_06764 [Puccinia striiformis f. sp. tritici PST-78]
MDVLIRGSAQTADIVVFINQITRHLSSTISDNSSFKDEYSKLAPKWIEESIRLTQDM